MVVLEELSTFRLVPVIENAPGDATCAAPDVHNAASAEGWPRDGAEAIAVRAPVPRADPTIAAGCSGNDDEDKTDECRCRRRSRLQFRSHLKRGDDNADDDDDDDDADEDDYDNHDDNDCTHHCDDESFAGTRLQC